MTTFPQLRTEAFVATVADNSPLGVHRGGYNGIASLVPTRTGNNLFVPTYSGLNYETIALAGLTPYADVGRSKFEPRAEPMRIDDATDDSVVLIQPETSHAHVSARVTFTVEPPCYLHQKIELVFHRRFCSGGEMNAFSSLWASYLHTPRDRHVYTKAGLDSADLSDWIGITKEDHHSRDLLTGPLPSDRELRAAEHLAAMADAPATTATQASRQRLSPMADFLGSAGPLPFYYGLCDKDLLFLMMFRQPDRFRFAYSPCGGGTEPAWSPAWDYVLHLGDAELDRTYVWDLCLVVKDNRGRADVLEEVRRYSQVP